MHQDSHRALPAYSDWPVWQCPGDRASSNCHVKARPVTSLMHDLSRELAPLPFKAMVLYPGPGQQQDVPFFVVTQHLIYQLKQLVTQLAHFTWFLWSESVADAKAKTWISTPWGSPGQGARTTARRCKIANMWSEFFLTEHSSFLWREHLWG